MSQFSSAFMRQTSVLVLFFCVAVWPAGIGDDDQWMSAVVSSGLDSAFTVFEMTVSWK